MDGVTSTAFYTKPESTPERREFYARIDKLHAAPLWEVLAAIIPPVTTSSTPSSPGPPRRGATRFRLAHRAGGAAGVLTTGAQRDGVPTGRR